MSIESRRHQYGLVFDHWQIKESLGYGSGGKTAVYRLEHTDGSGVCSALKVISLIEDRGDINKLEAHRRTDYNQARERYWDYAKQEVLLMNGLRGKTNVVGYLDHKYVDWSDGKSFGRDMLILMELLHDLRSDIQTGQRFSENEIIKIGRDICTALVLCHGKRIIHRDIKPENIFYNEDGDFKLGDFGISKIMSATPRAAVTTDIGTPEYAAPEQTSGKYDERVDIYSLGLVLYELGNDNHLPFVCSSYASAEEMENAMRKRLHGELLPAPSQVSERLAAVILKACSYKADDRYQTAQAFLDALNNLPLQTLPTTAATCISETDQVTVESVHATQKALPKHSQFATTYAGDHKSSNSTVAALPAVSPGKNKKILPIAIIIGILIVVGLLWALLGGISQSGNDSTLANDAESSSVETKDASTESSGLPSTSNESNVTLQGISIESLPKKTTYYIGESLDTDGMKVKAEYSDGTTQIISSNLSVSPSTFSTLGNQTITVSYKGYSTIFTVVVEEKVEGPVREITWKEINAGSTYDSAKKLSGFLLQCMFTCDPHNEDGFTVENSFGGEGGHKPFFVDGAGYGYMYFSFWIPNDATLEGWHSVTLHHDGTFETVEFYLDYIGDYSHILGTPDSVTGLGWVVSEWRVVE